MFPALQSSRPKHPPPQQPQHPSYQQTRSLQRHAEANVQPPQNSTERPQNQIEAMPPYMAPNQASASVRAAAAQSTGPTYNAALMHPVFFTGNLRKPPFPLPFGSVEALNPAAAGYVLDHRKVLTGPATKL